MTDLENKIKNSISNMVIALKAKGEKRITVKTITDFILDKYGISLDTDYVSSIVSNSPAVSDINSDKINIGNAPQESETDIMNSMAGGMPMNTSSDGDMMAGGDTSFDGEEEVSDDTPTESDTQEMDDTLDNLKTESLNIGSNINIFNKKLNNVINEHILFSYRKNKINLIVKKIDENYIYCKPTIKNSNLVVKLNKSKLNESEESFDTSVRDNVVEELFDLISEHKGKDYLSDEEYNRDELLDCIKDFGNEIDGFDIKLVSWYANALRQKYQDKEDMFEEVYPARYGHQNIKDECSERVDYLLDRYKELTTKSPEQILNTYNATRELGDFVLKLGKEYVLNDIKQSLETQRYNQEELDEATSGSRLMQHISVEKSFAAISAERHNGDLEKLAQDGDKKAQHQVQVQQEMNNRNTKKLAEEIKSLGLSYIKTYGAWKEGTITFENSFFVNDISKKDALRLGRMFDQYAIIYKPAGEQTGYLINTTEDNYGDIELRFDFTNSSKFSQITTTPDNLSDYTGFSGLKAKSKNSKNIGFNYSFNPVFSDDEIEKMRDNLKNNDKTKKAQ